MADVSLTAKLETPRDLIAGLERLNPAVNKTIAARALTESMLTVLRYAATKAIYPGGGRRAPVKSNILTSRTGTLRRSLSSSFALDRSGLPRYLEGGTNLIYGAVHEYGRSGRSGLRGAAGPLRPGTNRGTRARPFLRPALAATQREFEGIFTKWWEREGQR